MPKNKYVVKFAPKANEDMEEIFDYISGKLFAEIAAINLLEKIEESIMRLEEFPFSCSLVTDELIKNKGYRKLHVENFIVFYLVDETQRKVIVMRVLYGAQNYLDFL